MADNLYGVEVSFTLGEISLMHDPREGHSDLFLIRIEARVAMPNQDWVNMAIFDIRMPADEDRTIAELRTDAIETARAMAGLIQISD